MTSESEVRLYSRTFPAVFERARGAELFSAGGRAFLDFFCGAGALNYGHDPERIRDRLIEHLQSGAVVHALDMDTPVKAEFLRRFGEVILKPRGLDHRVQFCGPTGADAVEAALKLARKVTGRSTVAAFMGGFHGMTAGALAVSGNRRGRAAAASSREHAVFVPFGDDGLAYLDRWFADPSSGADLPAAVIVEPLQLEGGVIPAGISRVAARLAAFEAPGVVTRGRGCVLGLDLGPARAAAAQRRAFEVGLLVERCGREDRVLKLMPPLTIADEQLDEGLARLAGAL